MRPFAYQRAHSATEAIGAAAPGARFLGGGTSLLDLMKLGVESAAILIDLNRADDLRGLEWKSDGTLRIGAAVRMAALARHSRVAEQLPVLHQGLLAGATPQLRNMATIGGNLLQRTRCVYFRDVGFAACNKRAPGTGCAAIEGVNDEHAVFGWSESCVAVHPSDLAVALLALDATLVTSSRTLALEALHRLPGADPAADTVLEPGELIVAVEIAPSPRGLRSVYAKAPPAGGFAVAAAAVALEISADTISSARVALGGVAHKPWRSAECEAALVGKPPCEKVFQHAARVALAPARPLAGNRHKVTLAETVLIDALATAAR